MSNIIPFKTARLLPGFPCAGIASGEAASLALAVSSRGLPGVASQSRVKALDEAQAMFDRQPGAPSPSLASSPTPQEWTRRGLAALKRLTGFIGGRQLAFVTSLIKTSEEREWFALKMEELAAIIENMPVTYGQDGKGDDAICYLHYFGGSYDGYLTEKDMEEATDPAEAQWQAYGFVRWAHMPDSAECGYICLPEIFQSNMELDFHFTPTTAREIKRKHGALVEEESAADCLNSDSDDDKAAAEFDSAESAPLPKPADNAPADPVAGQLHIRIERAEGYSEEYTPHHYADFATAWACLQAHGHTAPAGGGYDKTDVCVTFPDGQAWAYRYDLTHGGSDSGDGCDFVTNLRNRISYYAGRWTPDWMIAKGRHNNFIDQPEPEAVAILDRWGNALELISLLPNPACHAPAEEDATVSDAEMAETLAILQQPYLTSETAQRGSGWRVGAVMVETWGYEQTNKDFYQIVERKGDWLTLIPLTAIQTRHKDPGGTDAMRGTSMPGPSEQDVKPMRRKIRHGSYGPIAKGEHGGLDLWKGTPESWTDYA